MSNPNTFVLQEVIDHLVNSQLTLVDPLTKLNYFGRLIKNDELIQYTLNELNGYKSPSEIPAYRKTSASLVIHLQAYVHTHVRTLPVSMLDEPLRSSLKYLMIKDGIATVESFVKSFEGTQSDKLIIHELPMEMLHYIEPAAIKLYVSDASISVISAKLTAPTHVMIDIANAVRTKLLALTMQVGEKFGYNIEIDSFKKNQNTNNQTINNYMKTEVTNSGDGVSINTGSHANITSTITVNKGDSKKLNEVLAGYGIEKEDIQELNDIIEDEQPDYENKKLGVKANSWIWNIVVQSLNGIGKIATAASGNILATLIKAYYGIDN